MKRFQNADDRPEGAITSCSTSMPFVSIIMPTYNRAKTLKRLYDSLRSQQFQDLEWIIIDDGSTDDTTDLVDEWLASGNLKIVYHRQENSGRAAALNRGIDAASGTFGIFMDSDDWLHDEALQSLSDAWQSIPLENRDAYAGVTGLCAYADGRVIGTPFPAEVFDSDFVNVYASLAVSGDKKEMVRMSLLKQHPFPSFSGERRVATSLLWIRIGANHKTRFVNKVVAYKEYHADGMTATIDVLRAQSPLGSLERYMEFVTHCRDAPLLVLVRNYVNYCRYSLHAGRSLSEQRMQAPSATLWFAGMLPGWVLYLRDLKKLAQLDASEN